MFCDVFLSYTLSISLLRCYCSCSMPPARATRGRGRGRPSRQASSVRQTRSRARAVPVDPDCAAPPSSPPFVDTLPFQPVSFGRPPPQCDELQDFDTAPGLRAVVTDLALARSTWERDMERRVVSSERMLGEIHNLVLNLRPNPAVAAPSAALGSAVQSVSVDMPPGEGRHAVSPVTAPAGHALPPFPDAPWPSVDTFFPGTAAPPLSEDTQTLFSSCTSTALPLDAQIPDVLRAKIMAGDYIDLSLLLKPSLIQPQEFALSIDRGASQPTVCVFPARPKDVVLSIDQWGRAFQLYMSVYLLQPANLPCAVKMLKYMEVVRGLADAGGDWRSYDAAFRTLRGRCGWAWDSISWELWLKASQSQAGRRLAAGPPFQGQGRARPPASSPCFAFNRGELCRSDTCRYTHKCRFCGGAHPVVRCFKAQAHGKSPRPAFPPSGPSGGASTASGLPAWHRR